MQKVKVLSCLGIIGLEKDVNAWITTNNVNILNVSVTFDGTYFVACILYNTNFISQDKEKPMQYAYMA